jgi:hypothetical protein
MIASENTCVKVRDLTTNDEDSPFNIIHDKAWLRDNGKDSYYDLTRRSLRNSDHMWLNINRSDKREKMVLDSALIPNRDKAWLLVKMNDNVNRAKNGGMAFK